MSDELRPLPSGADEVEAQAADWMQRRHFWTWSEQDQSQLDAWLAETPAHLVSYLRLEAAFNRADRLAALRKPLATRLARFARKTWWPLLGRGAAILVIVAGLAAAASQFLLSPVAKIYSASVGEHKTIALFDGSRIELNTDTVLRVAVDKTQRKVWFDKGEAYFAIHHDAAHPFIVITGDHRITDLGTEFLVRKEFGGVEVSLVEGRARIDTASPWRPSQSALLTPGDVVMATANSMSLMKKSSAVLGDEMGWRRGLLIFRDTALADAAAQFNRYNTRKIIIADHAVARLVVGGTFPANDAPLFVRAAQGLFGLHVENRGTATVISR